MPWPQLGREKYMGSCWISVQQLLETVKCVEEGMSVASADCSQKGNGLLGRGWVLMSCPASCWTDHHIGKISRVCARCVLHMWLTQSEQLSDQCDKGKKIGDFIFQKWANCSKLRGVPSKSLQNDRGHTKQCPELQQQATGKADAVWPDHAISLALLDGQLLGQNSLSTLFPNNEHHKNRLYYMLDEAVLWVWRRIVTFVNSIHKTPSLC